MKKCVGLLMVAMLGSTAWAGFGDMGLSLMPMNPMCNQNVMLKVQMSMPMSCHFRTEMGPRDDRGTCMVDVFEDCDGCNRERVKEMVSCDLGRNLCAGQHMVWVRHFINPCHKPKCKQCCKFASRDRPQLWDMKSTCFNVCSLNMNGFWWMRP
jgi:hypothetical protein